MDSPGENASQQPPEAGPRTADDHPSIVPTPLTVAEVARRLDVNRRTVQDWRNKGCPLTSIEAVIAWRGENLQTEHTPLDRKGGPIGGEVSHDGVAVSDDGDRPMSLSQKRLLADTRKIIEDTKLKKLAYRVKSGDLLVRTAAEREVASLVLRVKERLLAVPDEFENRFPIEVRASCKADLAEAMRLVLVELSRFEVLGKTTDEIIVAEARRILEREQTPTTPMHPQPPPEASPLPEEAA